MIEISSNSKLFDLFSTNDTIIVADFYATWCHPCQQMLKILPRLETEIEGIATIVKIDFDTVKSLVELYNVKKIPTFIFFRDGQEVHRFEGIKTLKEIEHLVNSIDKTL